MDGYRRGKRTNRNTETGAGYLRDQAKGQIVIPKQARDIFGIKPGDTLLLLGDDKRGIAIPPKGAFAELFGIAFQERDGDKE